MDLHELLNGQELHQDKWSTSDVTFPQNKNLRVVGWSGKNSGNAKYYIFHCSVCAEDTKLFGEGYFKSLKGGLTIGRNPCGCSRSYAWTKQQYEILCKEKAKELGFSFIAFEGEWLYQNTKIEMFCAQHGVWKTGSIANLLLRHAGCPMCGLDKLSKNMTKPKEEMVESFFASGAFHPETEFWKSERKSSQGRKVYWHMSCPECGETGETRSSDLQKGKRPCACSKQRQQECYINWVIDYNWEALAVKFGIARASQRRVKSQNSKSAYKVVLYQIYYFPDGSFL